MNNLFEKRLKRREFFKFTIAFLIACVYLNNRLHSNEEDDQVKFNKERYVKRFKGFNLLQKFSKSNQGWEKPYSMWDLDFMAEYRFNFIRVPLDYRILIEGNGYNEEQLKQIEELILESKKRNIHVNVCLHRVPGYCVNSPKEELNLFGKPEEREVAMKSFLEIWKMLTIRFKNFTSEDLSFNLINEPPDIDENMYVEIVKPVIDAIREITIDRPIYIDGIAYGRKPVKGLIPLKVIQCTRGYDPFRITHYKAPWIEGSDEWPLPTWPLRKNDGSVWVDKTILYEWFIKPWISFRDKYNVEIFVGEWGVYNKTPHNVTLAFMEDYLKILKHYNIGWALWNLRGPLGPLDSEREDVKYENYKGHKLDRRMLEILVEG